MKKSDDARRRNLDATAKMFHHKGYNKTTLKGIGALAKIQAPVIYYCFSSKEQLLEEVLNIGITGIHEAVEEAVAAAPARSSHRNRIEAAIRDHLATLPQHSDYTAATIINNNLAPRKVRDRHRVRWEKYTDYWRSLLPQAQAAGEIGPGVDLILLRLFVLSALFWTYEWYHKDHDPIDDMVAKLSAMLCDGIGGTT